MSQPNELKLYPLPYTAPQPPSELFRDVETESGQSSTTAFNTGLDNRDIFLGKRSCVICGESGPAILDRCYIIGHSDITAWQLLKRLGWVPAGAKELPNHETRNGLIMCSNHHAAFDNWVFFIRFQPATKKYIFMLYDSYSAYRGLQQFHGKAIAVDIKDNHAPLPLLFLAHEYMVHGRNFYQPTPNLKVTNDFQDWVINEGMVNEGDGQSFSFKRKAPTSGPAGQSLNVQMSPTTQVASASGSRIVIMPPTADLVEELAAYQHTMPSWKMCQREAMGWKGTAEENMKKYVENIGVESAE